jgi:hypothetical protein
MVGPWVNIGPHAASALASNPLAWEVQGSIPSFFGSVALQNHHYNVRIEESYYRPFAAVPAIPGAPCWYPPCILDSSTETATAREARTIQPALTPISSSQQAPVLWRASG